MKTLSVQQPMATLICAGVKRVENRTWKTDFRGKLLIHASGNSHSYPDFALLPEAFQEKVIPYDESDDWSGAPDYIKNWQKLIMRTYKFYGQDWENWQPPEIWHTRKIVEDRGWFMPAQAIIGETTLADIITDSQDDFAIEDQYHWIMTDPILYDKPILQVMGRLRLWDFQKTA